jgi:hypothetical protein
MNINDYYAGTFYSNVNAPSFTGLLQNTIEVHWSCTKHNNDVLLDLDIWVVQLEFNGEKRFEVIKSQSKYKIPLTTKITPLLAYSFVYHATEALKNMKPISAEDYRDFLSWVSVVPFEVAKEGAVGFARLFQ